jgi:Tfp pilus assembly protein PilO
MVKENPKLDKYKYMIVVLTTAILGSILALVLIGRPLYNGLKKTGAELKDRKAVLAKEESNLSALKTLESRKEELLAKNQKVLAALPTDKDIARLFVQYESVAREAGVTIENVSEAGASDGQITDGLIVPVSYAVSASAPSYQDFIRSLQKMEDAIRILSISAISISSDGGKITASYTINTFMRGGQN